ncbi:MAG: AAA family ATPase [Chloroflexi bacterium]|nr:AAA family ATPase [Chloroflexota bacterium]
MDNLEATLAPYDTPPKPPDKTEIIYQDTEENPSKKITTWADIENQIGPITFDWKPWLPAGLLSIVASDAGIGKSALALRLAGCYTDNLPWPDGTSYLPTGGTVLWCEAEAAQAVNFNRAKKWNLSLNRIITPFTDGLLDVNLDNKIHMAIVTEKAMLPGVRFIVVDSLSGSNNRKEKDSEIKQVTEFLARLARDSEKPILLTHHLRKRGLMDGDTVNLDQVRGSSAIVQAARVVWALDKPNRNSSKIRLSMIKNNLTRFADPIGLEITEDGVTFGDAPSEPKDETVTDRAADLLIALLSRGPLPQSEIEQEFKGAGISNATMYRAKNKLHIVSKREGTRWLWGLPTGDI